jgi:hypothetical protein
LNKISRNKQAWQWALRGCTGDGMELVGDGEGSDDALLGAGGVDGSNDALDAVTA